MYSYDERKRAVDLYIKYGFRPVAVIRELGYPDRHQIVKWYKEYISTGTLKAAPMRKRKFSEWQKQEALRHYQDHGKCMKYTISELGYPGLTTFKRWLAEAYPERKKYCVSGGAMVKYPQKNKLSAAVALCARTGSARAVADEYGVSPVSLYKWKKQLLGEGVPTIMPKTDSNETKAEQLTDEIRELKAQEATLRAELYKLQLEYDVLKKAADVLKKAEGINLTTLTNHEKTVVIDALRSDYRLRELLTALNISKSSYCYQAQVLRREDKYQSLRIKMSEIFHSANGCYGYRRIHAILKRNGTFVSEKVVRRLMHEDGLTVYRTKRRKYNSYVGEVSPAVENLIDRNFHADAPNMKWLTDITEFSIPAGKAYLSPIIDCFDGMVVSWTVGTSPSADLVNTMLDEAVAGLQNDEKPIVHSDRGGPYRWPGWIERMTAAKLTRSMSKKGCSPDNSACEGFFGRMKNEMFYGRSWRDVELDDFIAQVDQYIRWYNQCRIKKALGWMSPMEYRCSLGLLPDTQIINATQYVEISI